MRCPPTSTLFPYTTLFRSAGFIHERCGAKQHDLLAVERAFGRLALKTTAPWCEIMTPRDLIDGHKADVVARSEEHTSELQSRQYLVCRLLLEKKKSTSQYL